MKTPELLPPPDTMYRALVNRDPSFEGICYAGVRTTGIFCRPTCAAKKPERVNVDFFATSSEALHSGYRPCLRCHPMDPDQSPPKLIARLRAEVDRARSEEHTSELQSLRHLVCRLLLEKKKKKKITHLSIIRTLIVTDL